MLLALLIPCEKVIVRGRDFQAADLEDKVEKHVQRARLDIDKTREENTEPTTIVRTSASLMMLTDAGNLSSHLPHLHVGVAVAGNSEKIVHERWPRATSCLPTGTHT